MDNEEAWFDIGVGYNLEEIVDTYVEHIVDDDALDPDEFFGRWLDTYLLLEEVLSK